MDHKYDLISMYRPKSEMQLHWKNDGNKVKYTKVRVALLIYMQSFSNTLPPLPLFMLYHEIFKQWTIHSTIQNVRKTDKNIMPMFWRGIELLSDLNLCKKPTKDMELSHPSLSSSQAVWSQD